MKRKIKKLTRKIKRTLKIMLGTSYYCHYFYRSKIKKKTILFESRNGYDVAGNIFYLMKELRTGDYDTKKVYLAVCPSVKKRAVALLGHYNIRGIHLVKQNSMRYYKLLATVNYIFTDTSMPRSYIKKDCQIIVNTWHGTPLKKMGKYNIAERHSMGNIQRNLLFSDYLVFPNDYMRDKMLESYNIDTSFEGEILCEGYPRNSVFFNTDNAEKIKSEIGFSGKELYVYMPTWKAENMGRNMKASLEKMREMLFEIDELLSENQVMLLKLHPLVRANADASGYKHIKTFPEGYEPYQILSCCDALITDYSSVFFDFANSKKKILMFVHDEEEYDDSRGFYFSLDELPFPKVRTPKQLVDALNAPISYDDAEFCKTFCTYDNLNAAKNILSHVLKGEDSCRVERIEKNKKQRVLLYPGGLLQNGITASFKNLLGLIDLDEREYYVAIREFVFSKNKERLDILPDKLKLYSISSGLNFTFAEAIALLMYYRLNSENKLVMHYVNRLYAREFKKHFSALHMDYMVNFCGYERYLIALLQQYDAKKVIFVHSDMEKEMAVRKNQHRPTLRSAYRDSDKVAVVTDAMAPSVGRISGRRDNIVTVSNSFDYKRVIENSFKEIEFQKESRIATSAPDGIEGILQSDAKKFITVGRYSSEKQHFMLIDAFDEYYKENPNSYLIIIGGRGELYEKTISYANSKACGKNVACLWSVSNPMPIIKKCDLFILSSKYEALGLVLLEADALGVPCICTEMDGPRKLLESHGGTMVENSAQGIVSGMKLFDEGKVKAMNIDFEKYNEQAISQFQSLFN